MRLSILTEPAPHFALDGRPFRMQADTAWELFHRLTPRETIDYLDTRAAQGFTALMAVGLAELDGLDAPSAQGHLPLIDRDPSRPNPAYWEHVAWAVDQANSRGLQVGFVPSWGCWWNPKWAKTEPVFTAENAADFGHFVGRLLAGKGVFWILGGDRPLAAKQDREIIEQMAIAIKAEDPKGIFTLHPMGGMSSADIVGEPDWLDFHMIQSGHSRRDEGSHRTLAHLPGMKPVVDAEPCYENHPIGFDPAQGWFGELDVRRRILEGLFAGGIGAFYGCHDVWQMLTPGAHEPITQARGSWRESLRLPGAERLGTVLSHFEGGVWKRTEPVGACVRGPLPTLSLPLAGPNAFLAYLSSTRAMSLHMKPASACWIEPESGARYEAEISAKIMAPPFGDHERDWLLRLDG